MRLVYQLISYVFWTSRALSDRTILPCTGFSTDSTSSSGGDSTSRRCRVPDCLVFVGIDFWCCRGSGGSVEQSVGDNFSLSIELLAEAPPLSGGSAEAVVVGRQAHNDITWWGLALDEGKTSSTTYIEDEQYTTFWLYNLLINRLWAWVYA
jgi:hypothetical protein